MRKFEVIRLERDKAGRLARGREDGEPFQGDPIAELVEECADGVNYAEEAFNQRILERWEYAAICYHLRTAARLALGEPEQHFDEGEDS